MNGQWIGSYTGSTGGTIIVNIDEREFAYQGVAYLLAVDATTYPASAAYFRTANKNAQFQFRTEVILPIDPSSGYPAPWEAVKQHYPETVGFSKYADVVGSWSDESLTLSWRSDLGATGSCSLPSSKSDRPSELVPLDKDWGTYKEYVAGLKGRKFLFRGQRKGGEWRLRTSFHRSGRAELTRFLQEDIQVLYKHLSARTRHIFNLREPDENGAFLNLVQHHGYPTPLLDWTYSPYVAAFFAYRGVSYEDVAKAQPGDKVRIHVFDQAQWRADLNQIHLLNFAAPHVSISEFIAIENERMIPQQSASTVTNVDDIESYIKTRESESKKYLYAIDLPVHERRQVIRDLSYMGITAGSLFPGLDGACEELKERNFEL